MARVTGLHRLALNVPNPGQVAAFYADTVGMTQVAADAGRVLLRSAEADHADLLVEAADAEPTWGHVCFSVAGRAQLDELVQSLQQAGCPIVRAPAAAEAGEWSAVVADPDGNRVELVVPAPAMPRGASGPARHGPKKLGHVVLWTPQVEAMEAFYARLGMPVTDRTAIGMSFLRCNRDHHSLALVRSRGRTGLQHVAWDVDTVDAVMREVGRLSAAGVKCIWGPGRHGPGNNVFSYYRDPSGNVFEFYGELQRFDDDELPAEPVFWGTEHRGDIWGIAGPPPEEFRS